MNLFRKKSLENLDSPENLDSYLKVTSIPGWLVIIAVIILIIGCTIWGFTSKIDGQIPFSLLFK